MLTKRIIACLRGTTATSYNDAFTVVVESDNVMGVQIRPEKSAATGLRVLQNFLELP